MNMNAEMIFNEFAKYAESDDKYYTWGKHGVIEDVLAWFNIPSGKFIGAYPFRRVFFISRKSGVYFNDFISGCK